MSDLCVLCRTEPAYLVCSTCIAGLDRQLRDLPRRLERVAERLVPSRTLAGEVVGTGAHVHAALPARIGALSLLGPGGDVPVTLHPLVRHWSTKRTVLVTTHVVGHARQVQVEVTDWFHEPVVDADGQPVMVPDDDQIGLVPPREWLDQQVRRWRAHFGHHVPRRTVLPRTGTYLPPVFRTLLHVDGGARTIGFLGAATAASGGHARLAYRGLLNAQPAPARAAPRSAMGWDVDYLRTWLEKACTQPELDPAGFAAKLRALHAEIAVVLEDTPDQEWIGRCPAFIAELDPDGQPTGRKRPCGGGLWQTNGAYLSAQVRCPRCQITWETRGHAGAGTAREIRRVWPIDRRRRYTADQIDRLTPPKCRGCGKRVRIEWRDVTGTRDHTRTWQPVRTSCPDGCPEARRAM